MNKIEQMIKDMCPEGVQKVSLGDVCDIKGRIGFRGYTRKDQVNEGEGALSLSPSNIHNGAMDYTKGTYITWGKYEESPEIKTYNGDIIVCKTASVGKVALVKDLPYKATINPQLVVLKNIQCDNSFLAYILQDKEFQKNITALQGVGSVPNVSQKALSSIKIPIPPLEVQQEIVSILDTFTDMIDNLNEELDLKQKQFTHYCEELIGNAEGEVKSLGEIGKMERGTGLMKSDFAEDGFPCIHYGQIHTYYGTSATKTKSYCSDVLAKKLRKAKHGDLLIATTSEDVEACCKATVWLGDGEVVYSGDSYKYSHSQNPKYIAYLFKTEAFAKQKRMCATGAKVVRVSGEAMEKFRFQFPSSEKQAEIVSILDTFEESIENIKEEIELRQKQYEYYREQLLTFE